jgi:hypothetical protein
MNGTCGESQLITKLEDREKNGLKFQHVLFRSILYSLISWCIALSLFAIVDELRMGIIHPDSQFNISVVAVLFFVGSILSIIPVMLGGFLLSASLYWYKLNDKISIRIGYFIGTILGVIIVLGISVFLFSISYYTGKIPINRIIEWTIEALFGGILAGGWTGFMVAKYIIAKSI